MEDRILDLQVNKVIQEYTYLKSDEDLKKELISIHQGEFLSIINEKLSNIPQEQLKVIEDKQEVKEKEPKLNTDDIPHNTKVKAKKIYREIVKLTHPDKVDDIELHELYMEAKEAYEDYDLFELYFIGKSLNIKLKLSFDEMDTLNKLIESKKESIKSLESSFVWIWLNSTTEEEKENLVDRFITMKYLREI